MRVLGALIAAVAIAALLIVSRSGPSPAAAAGAAIGFPSVACRADTASVTFNWSPISGAKEQWLDLSLADNGFAPGSFIAAGAFTPNEGTHTWNGIVGGAAHFWRINTLTSDGWVASRTGAFTPCGGPVVLDGITSCAAFRGQVDFRWAPMATGVKSQWLDLSLDPDFNEGSSSTYGPMPPAQQSYRWSNIPNGARYYFRVGAETDAGKRLISDTGSFVANCLPDVATEAYGSGDRLLLRRLGIDAPVNVRDVGFDGLLGEPLGASDVVRYNFPTYPSLGGYPGDGGTTMVSGHLDYYVSYAVFAPLRSVREGDVIEYRRADGSTIYYEVDWYSDIPYNSDWTSLAGRTDEESIVLITCNGTFDTATRNYDYRRVVHGLRVAGPSS